MHNLFKFRDFDNKDRILVERTKDIFLKNELYFSSPTKFNDPFDCKAHLDFTKISISEFWNYFDKALAKNTKLSAEQRREVFEDALKHDELESMFIDSLQKQFNIAGVYSMCRRSNDILMWSHYANGHRGYCFELSPLTIKAERVRYRKKYPKINLFSDERNI